VTAPSTTAFAASTSGRLGTAAKVARTMPEENSVVIASTPRVPSSNWPSTSPMKQSWAGSKAARPAAGS
jgi:hypothetical protein